MEVLHCASDPGQLCDSRNLGVWDPHEKNGMGLAEDVIFKSAPAVSKNYPSQITFQDLKCFPRPIICFWLGFFFSPATNPICLTQKSHLALKRAEKSPVMEEPQQDTIWFEYRHYNIAIFPTLVNPHGSGKTIVKNLVSYLVFGTIAWVRSRMFCDIGGPVHHKKWSTSQLLMYLWSSQHPSEELLPSFHRWGSKRLIDSLQVRTENVWWRKERKPSDSSNTLDWRPAFHFICTWEAAGREMRLHYWPGPHFPTPTQVEKHWLIKTVTPVWLQWDCSQEALLDLARKMTIPSPDNLQSFEFCICSALE